MLTSVTMVRTNDGRHFECEDTAKGHIINSSQETIYAYLIRAGIENNSAFEASKALVNDINSLSNLFESLSNLLASNRVYNVDTKIISKQVDCLERLLPKVFLSDEDSALMAVLVRMLSEFVEFEGS